MVFIKYIWLLFPTAADGTQNKKWPGTSLPTASSLHKTAQESRKIFDSFSFEEGFAYIQSLRKESSWKILITNIHRDTGQDGKLEEIPSLMLQGTNCQSLPWVEKTHIPTMRQLFLRCVWWATCFQPPLKQLMGLLPKTAMLNASVHFPGKQLESQMSLDKRPGVIRWDHPAFPATRDADKGNYPKIQHSRGCPSLTLPWLWHRAP